VSETLERCLPDWALQRAHPGEGFTNAESEIPVWVDEEGLLSLAKLDGHLKGRYRLRFSNQIVIDVRFDERVVLEWPQDPSVPPSTREHFIADQVLPRILGQQGRLVLHAGVVRIGDQAVLLLGKSGSGKSTLGASFGKAGLRLLGDDALIVSWRDGMPCASAVYPSLRLFPDSIDALFPTPVPTDEVAHYTPKLRVRVPLAEFDEASALPIRAVFVLSKPDPEQGIGVHRKSIADACMAFVENSFVLDPMDTERASLRLHSASVLASQVPAFDLTYPRAYCRLGDVRSAISDALDQSAGHGA
jgi:hypothetical protein